MQTSGFTNAPVSQFLLYYLVLSSVIVSISDVKFYFHIQIVPHLWNWGQWWRLLIWQGVYANAGEVLFATMAVYNLRVIERLWGSRKFASFLTYATISTSFITPFLLGFIFRPFTIWRMNYLPPGATPLIFAILAQYHATIPHVYKFRIAAPLPTNNASNAPPATPAAAAALEENETAITLSDKFYIYVVAAQLAFTQPPGSWLAAAVGWTVGYAWREEVLPWSKWRLPAWMFGSSGIRQGEYEGLRRAARGADNNTAAGNLQGIQTLPSQQQSLVEQQQQQQQQSQPAVLGDHGSEQGAPGRPLGTQILDQFRGTF